MDVVGITKVRGCCTFLWMQEAYAPRRIVFARPYHCAACVGEMVRSAKLQRITIFGGLSMQRVRGLLAARRAELVDRWDRQLRAAADAGFALDGETTVVLPLLLEAADRALERRFRPPTIGEAPISAEARRAATQCSLLGDFLFDAALESCPEMSVAEQRLLSDALAHAAVEVLVRAALEREEEKRRREAQRLAKLAHELRNSVTAAQLAVDLLKRKGAIADGKAARVLENALCSLRFGIEDSLLDELLTAGGLKMGAVRLGPVLADAHLAATECGANDRRITVVLEKAPRLHVEADARVMRPTVRGLLRAAIQLARKGSTIRVGAAAESDRARVAILVKPERKLAGNRLPDLPALQFVRRAAKAQGGVLTAKNVAGACELRLELRAIHPA